MFLRTFAALLALVCGSAAAAEESEAWLYRAWRTDDGLPDNCVTGVAQTAGGYLWVASRGGLLRFNGADFTPLPLAGLPDVPNRVIRSMTKGGNGRLWLDMDAGALVRLGPAGRRIYGGDEGVPGSALRSMAEDGDGNLWIAWTRSIGRLVAGKFEEMGRADGWPESRGYTRLTADAAGEIWYSRGSVVGVVREGKVRDLLNLEESPVWMQGAASGGLWLVAANRVLRFMEGGKPVEIGLLPARTNVRALFEDRSGDLWIGTAGAGLFHLDDGKLERVPTSHQEIDGLGEDNEGNIWACTNGGGLDLIQPRAMALIGREQGLLSQSVRSVCQDAGGDLWVAMQNGALERNGGGRWAEVDAGDGWTGSDAWCVAADRSGNVWVGSRGRGLHCRRPDGTWQEWTRPRGLASDAVRSILGAANGDVWIATDFPSRLQRLRKGKLLTLNDQGDLRTIRAMAESPDGTIWIATSNGSVLRADGDTLVPVLTGPEMRPGSIRSLCATEDGSLWIGYAGFGVGRWKGGKYARISTEQGLRDDYASQIFPDRQGNLWVAGNRGVFAVRLAEMDAVADGRAHRVRCRVFGRSQGLPSLQPSFDCYPSVCQTAGGRLLWAMRGGLLAIRPDRIHDNPLPPPVVLESVLVDDRRVLEHDNRLSLPISDAGKLPRNPDAAPLRLPPEHAKLEFQFAALSFSSPENVHFRYRLENFDKTWVEAGTQRAAIYPRLPAGDYEFRVIACNNAGVWNETGAGLAFVVTPFFWQTWWFRLAALAGFTAALVALVRYVSFRRLRVRMAGLEQQVALDRERARIARDMHDEVGSKLTRLSLLSDMASARPDFLARDRAEVLEISDTARETILAFDEIVWAVNPRNDTLGDLLNYLCRHAEDFFDGSPVQCVFDLPDTIPPVTLPTDCRHQVFLAAKEALTNVLKHSGAGQVTLGLARHPAAFEIVIEDDGGGFDTAGARPGGGNGLANMEHRLRSVSGRFESRDAPGGGTRISFVVPVVWKSRPPSVT